MDMINTAHADLKTLYAWGWRDSDHNDKTTLEWIGDRGLGPVLVAVRADIGRQTTWPVSLALFDTDTDEDGKPDKETARLEISVEIGRDPTKFADERVWHDARRAFARSFHRWEDRPTDHPIYDTAAEEAVTRGQVLVDRAGVGGMILVCVAY